MMIGIEGVTNECKQSFLTTGAWTTWAERGIVLPMKAGRNYIRLKSNTSEGGPNLDYLEMTYTDEPIAEPYDGSSHPGTISSDRPVVYVASDSTAQSYNASYAPQQGWGYYLQDNFTDSVTVSNHSIAGRSSKSFYDNGRLNTILDTIKAGESLIVCFGINDGAYNKEERYAPVCNNVDNPTQGSFEYYMTFYIKGALDKGATPILLSLTPRNEWPGGKVERRNDFCGKLYRQVAEETGVDFIDIHNITADALDKMGKEKAAAMFNHDHTHTSLAGAQLNCQSLAKGLKAIKSPLCKCLK